MAKTITKKDLKEIQRLCDEQDDIHERIADIIGGTAKGHVGSKVLGHYQEISADLGKKIEAIQAKCPERYADC